MSASVRLLLASLDKALKPHGLKTKFLEASDPQVEDDQIDIVTTDGKRQPFHVQVNSYGARMFNVVKEHDDGGFEFFPQTSKREVIVAKVEGLLK